MKRHGIVSTYQEKHKCMYCNYTSDKALSVARHIGIKHQAEGKGVLVKKKYGIEKYLKPMTAKDLPTRPSVIVANKLNITPPPPPQPSPVGEAEPELINHMVEKHENGRDNAENYNLPTRPSTVVANPPHITPPPPPPSPVVELEAELINHMVGEHENRRDNVGNYTTEVNVIYRDNVKGKNKKVDCRICHRAVGSEINC